jgi:O-antigen/teichoic acid export membrane protein
MGWAKLKTLRESFSAASGILFLGYMVGNGSNYLYQFLMGRWLSPGDFSSLNALLSLSVLTVVPTQALMLTAAMFAAQFSALGQDQKLADLRGTLSVITGLGMLVLVGLFLAAGSTVKSFFHLANYWPLVLICLITLSNFPLPMYQGLIQGLHRFGSLSALGAMLGLLRLSMAGLLVYLGFALAGSLGAVFLANLGALALTLYCLRDIPLRLRQSHLQMGCALLRYGMPTSLTCLFILSMSNIDLIVARHFLSANDAGHYSAAVVLGRMAFFLPGVLVTVLFPYAAKEKVRGRRTVRLLVRALLWTGLLSVSCYLLLLFWPQFMLRMLYGPQYDQAVGLLRIYSLAMVLLALANVFANYYLALKHYFFLWYLVAFSLSEVVCLSLFHSDPEQMAMVVLFNLVGLVAVLAAWSLWRETRLRLQETDLKELSFD